MFNAESIGIARVRIRKLAPLRPLPAREPGIAGPSRSTAGLGILVIPRGRVRASAEYLSIE